MCGISAGNSTSSPKETKSDKRIAPRLVTIAGGCAWLIALIAGGRAALRYEGTPGMASAAPVAWPAGTTATNRVARPKLLMFVHPKCPCSRASVAELASLLAECTGRVDAEVVFVRPAEFSVGWEQTDLWRSASSIPGVTVRVDPGGAEAQRFGAATSGTVLLYGPDGQLLFNGGITVSRGHRGPSDASAALARLLSQADHHPAKTTVYGCPLFNVDPSNPGGPSCKR